jgi:hypothetical protein
MFNSAILEVITGIVFIYLLLSLMCTALREGIEGFLRTRASYLESGIRDLLFDAKGDSLAKDFYEHPLIYSLFPGDYVSPASGKLAGLFTRGRNLPAYVPAGNFAAALVDLVARGPAPLTASSGASTPHPNADSTQPITIAEVRSHVDKIGNPNVRRAVLAALDTANGDLEKAKKNLERWYDSAMYRVSGRYKRSTQLVLLIIGLLIAVGFNIDTITLADYLYRNETQRGAIVAQAEGVAHDTSGMPKDYKEVRKQIEQLQLPIGWDFLFSQNADDSAKQPQAQQDAAKDNASAPEYEVSLRCISAHSLQACLTPFWTKWHVWFMKPLGWLLTAFAVTLGAPFWFDILNKIMIIRSTVKPHEKSPEEASEDRQTSADSARPSPSPAPTTIHIVQPVQPAPAQDIEPDSGEDCCHITATDADATPDNQLPAAQGGVS